MVHPKILKENLIKKIIKEQIVWWHQNLKDNLKHIIDSILKRIKKCIITDRLAQTDSNNNIIIEKSPLKIKKLI